MSTVLSLADRYGSYTRGEDLSPNGETVTRDAAAEFYVDEEKLDELVLSLFYAPKG